MIITLLNEDSNFIAQPTLHNSEGGGSKTEVTYLESPSFKRECMYLQNN